MAIFGPKPWDNAFGKMSIFELFELLVFIAYEGVLSVLNIVKDISLSYIAFKKEFEKWRFLDQNHGLTPLEKFQFCLDFLNFLFLKPRMAFSCSRILSKTFFGVDCLKKKVGKMAILDQNHGLTPFEQCQFFRVFELFVFIA